MTGIKISDRRASYDSAFFGGRVRPSDDEITIWNTEDFEPVAKVRPGFSRGKQRYEIDPFNHLIYSGTWENGLTCYDYEANRVVWHRDDLIGIQKVCISGAYPTSVFVALEIPDYRVDEKGLIDGVVELDASSARTIWHTERATKMFVHPSRPIVLLENRGDGQIELMNRNREIAARIEMTYFALIDAAFGSQYVALAVGKQGVRVLNYTGEVMNRYTPQNREPNCIGITFCENEIWVYDSWEGSYVMQINPRSGERISEYKKGPGGAPCFVKNGSQFVDGYGRILRTADGEKLGEIKMG